MNSNTALTMARYFAALTSLLLSVTSIAQLVVTPQPVASQLAAAISGPGVTISNPTIVCHPLGYGEFSYSGSGLGLEEGVLLTSGQLTNALGPNNNGSAAYNAQRTGSPILDIVTGRNTFDQCKLEFDIIPAGDSLRFNFSLGSEEYNEWVGSQFNDVFGFFISGPGITGDPGIGADHNIALVPGSSQPVTINNVNNGSNSAYFHDNTGGSEIQYDGYTIGLSAVSAVQPCQTYHLKLIIADATDNDYDSGVLIEKVRSNPVTLEGFTNSGGPDLVEGCNNGFVRFTRSTVNTQPLTLQYFLQGTATNGVDYQTIGNPNPNVVKTITIPANQAFVDRPINTLINTAAEPDESLVFILGNPNCPAQALDTVIMNLVDTLVGGLAVTPPGICLGSSLQFNATGGTNYQWTPSTGLSDPNIANPIASPTTTTTYQVVISDGFGCSRTIRRSVRVSNMTLSATTTAVLCNGGANGAINLTVSGGLAPFSYSWTGPNGFTATTEDISFVGAGTYTVSVVDAVCTRTQSFTLAQPNALSLTLSPNVLPLGHNISCFGANTGVIDATISGGTSPFNVVWTGPSGYTSNSIDIAGLGAGTYAISVTDANGCTTSASRPLAQPAVLAASISTFTNVTCNGANNGTATVNISGGVGPYTRSWNTTPAQSGTTATNLPPGTHIVNITDFYGCTTSTSVTITQPASALSSNLVSQTNVACRGASTGSASVSIAGGTAPYTYSWNTSPAQNSANAINLPAGTFTCTITDARGCTTTRTVTITQPATGINVSLASSSGVSCFGGNNGTATVTASGGNAPYSYSWNTTPIQSGPTANSLSVGTWTCTVTDASGCTASRPVAITQPTSLPSGSVNSITNNLCAGQSAGRATVSGTGGTAPYTFSWNTTPVQTSATVTNQTAGTYICTITDARGCTGTVTAVIGAPTPLVGTITSDMDVACYGQSTGSATVGASGGAGGYSYTWNTTPPQTTTTASNIPFGSYQATVTDANGCTTTANVVISQPASPLGTTATVTPAACGGPNTGAVNATVSGGTSPYTYQWSGPSSFSATTEDISSLAAGVYTLVARDANNCSNTTVWNVNPPGLFTITGVLSNYNGFNVACRNGSNGSIDVSVIGGTGPYTYAWNGPGAYTATSEDIAGVVAGLYTFTVTDALGCSSAQSFTLSQTTAIYNTLTPAIAANGYNVSCFGGSNGSISASPGGGVGSFSYTWSGPGSFTSNSQNISGRIAGTYTLVVTDQNSCSQSSSVTLTQPVQLSVNIGVNNQVSCFGGNNARATTTVTGGVAPYTFSWNTVPVKTTAMATNLTAGSYTCTVTDANGCTANASVTITQPPTALSLALVSSVDVLCRNQSTGGATMSASGGTPPYSYTWNSSPSQAGPTAINLPAGTFNCTVTDANGCTRVTSVTITQPATTPGCSFIDNVVHVTCFGANNGSARANGCGGTPGYTYSWSTTPIQTTPTATNLAPGLYTCTITDANGCTRQRTVTINGPSAGLIATISSTTHELCGGTSPGTGSATVSISGGTSPYSYSWNTTPAQISATATDLQNGNYTCNVTDANGCTASVNVTISEPNPIGNNLLSISQVSCNGAANGSASVQGTGGTLPYTYLWSNGAVTATASSLTPGNYTCRIRDLNNCESTRSITITEPPVLFVTATTQTASCTGANSGAVNLSVVGGTTPYTYSWTGPGGFTATTQDITSLSAGAFSVVVTDARGCANSSTWSVTDPGSFTITVAQGVMANGLNLLCNGGNNAWITNEVRGGQQPYSYSWTGPGAYSATTDDVSGLSAGTYVFTVTDAIGCSTSRTYSVTQPAPFVSAIVGNNAGGGFNISCTGGSNGSTSGSITGGNAPLSYSWTGPGGYSANTPNVSGGLAGTYNLAVTDAFGCTFNTSIVLTQPTVLSNVGTALQHVLCRGAATGSASATATGGVGPYSYAWNTVPAQVGPLATGLPAGTWTCTVTDANGCSSATNVTISEPATNISAVIGGSTPVACFGGNTGSITASVSGGVPNYSYSWNTTPVQTTATATGLSAGNYTCTITDANGCTTTISGAVSEPAAALNASLAAQTNVSCFGAVTGSATVTASGGTAPYLYVWNTSPVQSTATANALTAGSWTCTVTDARGCTADVTVTITQPAGPLGASITSQTPVACFGNSTGNATAAATGGTAPYAYSWNTSPVQTNATATALPVGTYTCTITDANGCSGTTSVTITAPAAALTTNINSNVDVACFGQSTGSASVNAQGGTAPYSYSWNTAPVQTTSFATNLPAGSYTCTVTDANGCTRTTSIAIAQPASPLAASLTGQTDVGCFGLATGTATVATNGGTAPYTYAWNTTPVQGTPTATDLAAGVHACTITDANGCSATVNVTIAQPAAALSASVSGQINVLCFGESTGSATAVPSGGTAPYTYSWNTFPAQNTTTATALAAGAFTCTITDANGCTSSASVTITQPGAAVNVTATIIPAACQGANNGAVNSTPSGGVSPYTYAWSGPSGFSATTQDISGVEAGVYTLVTTDANGCAHTSNWNVNQPGLFTVSHTTSTYAGGVEVSCIGATDGSINMTVSGATPPYTFSWSGPGGYTNNTEDISALEAGTYTFVVTDANGCSTSETITLNAPAPFSIGLTSANMGNGFSVACNGGSDGSIAATTGGGIAPLSFAWSGPNGFTANTEDIFALSAGAYTLTISDANGCTANSSIILTEPTVLSASSSMSAAVGCFGESSGSTTSSASGGVAPYSYAWNSSPVQSAPSASGLSVGSYTVTITDANGCTATSSATVTGPPTALSAAITGTTDVLCKDNSTGSATASASGGTAPYSYAWNSSPVQNSAIATGLTDGSYTCTVTDVNGCATTTTATINEPAAALAVNANMTTSVGCIGGGNGAASAAATGGTAPYTYVWNSSPVQTGSDLLNVVAGIYTVSVTDDNGCTANTLVTITEPAQALSVGISSVVHQDCFGSNNGQAAANASGGTAPYSYSWNTTPPQSGSTMVGQSTGTFTVVVTDARGCTAVTNVTINGPTAALSLSITAEQDVLCHGASTGSATVDAIGGTAPYTYEWNTVPQTFAASIVDQPAGTYAVIVTDANGCSSSITHTIEEPLTHIAPFLETVHMVDCHGGSTGYATIDISGGSGSYSVVWNTTPVQTGNTISGLTAGTYLAQITDDNGCTESKFFPVTITEPSAPLSASNTASIFAGGYNTSCALAHDASIDASVSGGTTPYTYIWSTSIGATLTDQDITDLPPGDYDLVVTDANGCVATTNRTIVAPAELDITSSVIPAACQGAANGAINTNPLGGVAPYTLAWSGPNGFTANTVDISGLVAGIYTLSITDVNGCNASFPLDVNQPGIFSTSTVLGTFPGGWNTSCNGAQDGSIDLSVSGGTPGYTYTWIGPNGYSATTQDISGLAAGDYSAVINDANGCGTLVQVTLTTPASLSIALNTTTIEGDNITCNGASDGLVDATVFGGTPNYSYTWTGPNGFSANTEDISSLSAGSFAVSVVDANGCTTTNSILLTEPAPVQASATAQVRANGDNISCNGLADGSVDLTISGGHGPYTVTWSGPNGFNSTDQDLASLAPGNYTATVVDANGCSSSVSITLTEPAPLAFSSATSAYAGGLEIGCAGGTNGSIDVTTTGGAGNYTFAWSGTNAFTAVTEDLTGLAAGSYSVTITDQNGCQVSGNEVLSEPAPINSTASIVPAACQGSANGALDLTVTGGTAPYTYNWNSGFGSFNSTDEDLTALLAGIYTVNVTDANGCTAQQAYNVGQPDLFTISAVIVDHTGGYQVSCNGSTDGSIDATVTGGTAPYFYFWSGPNGTVGATEDVSGLGAGNYTLIVTDQNGCSGVSSFQLNEPTPIDIGLLADTYHGGVNTTCENTPDGSIETTISGGEQPYNILWTGPDGSISISEDLTGLPAGEHIIVVTDAIGCTATDTITLNEPDQVSTNLTTGTQNGGNNTSCFGGNDGSINLDIAGGTQPYLVAWVGPNGYGSNNEDLASLLAGSYEVTVTDANGCTVQDTILLSEPNAITIDLNAQQFSGGFNIPCHEISIGIINAVVSGGLPGYSYSWSSTNGFTSTDRDIAGLAPGDYTLSVTDQNGCTNSETITLTGPDEIVTATLISATLSGYEVSCAGNDGSIQVQTSGGTLPMQFSWFSANGFASQDANISGLAAGSYELTIIDDNGCIHRDTILLDAPEQLSATLTTGPVICNGANDGTIDLSVSGGATAYTYAWSGPDGFTATTEDLTNLAGGMYSVQVSDLGNCTGTWSTEVIVSGAMSADLYVSRYGDVNIPCLGDTTGVIELGIAGGVGPLTAAWTGPNGFTSEDFELTQLIAGVYHVTVTDANGCTLDSTITLTEPTEALSSTLTAALFPSGDNVSCFAGQNGSIEAQVLGGTAPYMFDWRGPDSTSFNTPTVSGLIAGEYDLVVTDANLCAVRTTITLTQPEQPVTITASLSDYHGFGTSCEGTTDGTISTAVNGGSPSYTYLWSGPNGFTSATDSVSGLVAGDYTVVVTDTNGCTQQLDLQLIAPEPISPGLTASTFPGGTAISCAGADDGTISLSFTGGAGSMAASWTGPSGFTASGFDLQDLAAGTYCVLLTDANGCTAQDCITLDEPGVLLATATATAASCGQPNGSVDGIVTGGSAPYTYSWSNGSQSEDINGLTPATYTLTATDANGCDALAAALVSSTDALAASTSVSAVTCNGQANGTATVTPSNGQSPHSYLWSNGATTSTIDGLAAGTYQVTVTDVTGCGWSGSVTIDEPNPLELTGEALQRDNGFSLSGYGSNDGSITVEATGGTPDYTYTWSNGATTAIVNGLAAGEYTVTVTDANGCSNTLSFVLDQPMELAMPTGYTPNRDGSNDLYVIQGLEAFPANEMVVFNRWGNVVYERLNYKNDWAGENNTGEPLPNGTYFVILTLTGTQQTLQNYVDLRR